MLTKRITFGLLILFSTLQSYTQTTEWNRTIIWLHGLAGDPVETWSKATSYSESNYLVLGFKGTYGNNGLLSAGEQFNTFLHNNQANFEGENDPYIISHSQGGLVARASEKIYTEDPNLNFPYGGIVTFGTPHHGAQLLDNIEEIKGLISEGCRLFLGPYISAFFNSNFLLSLFDKAPDALTSFACEDVLPILVDLSLRNSYLAPITEDFRPGNGESYLNTELSNFSGNSSIYKVAFYGEETDNELWRLLYWLGNNSPEEPHPFGSANDDGEYISLYKEFADREEARSRLIYLYHISQSNFSLGVKKSLLSSMNLQRISNDRARFVRGLNSRWLRIIGALDMVVWDKKFFCLCDDENEYIFNDEWEVNDPSECDPGCKLIESGYAKLDRVDQSDAVVLSTSAKGEPWSTSSVGNFVMPGSNHQQMRNDQNTRDNIILLYTGGYGSFFTIP